MKECLTLWLSKEQRGTGQELVKFLESSNLRLSVRYMDGRAAPILFTRLGSFEGDSNIRRAASLLAAEEVA